MKFSDPYSDGMSSAAPPGPRAVPAIRAAEAAELPDDRVSVDPCLTPHAHAVFPPTYEEEGVPSSRELLLDDRVERLLKENLELLRERTALRAAGDARIKRCNELLAEARKAKKLARSAIQTREVSDLLEDNDALRALDEWAAAPL